MLRSVKNVLQAHRTTLCFAAGVLILFLLPLFAGDVYFGLDLSLITIPQLCENQTLRQNGWPIWVSPYLGGGEPLFAGLLGQFLYPIRWVERLFDPETGASVGIALHFFCAFLGVHWLARTFGLSSKHARVAALFYVFSGTVWDLILHSLYIVGGAWLPWAWAGIRTVLRRSGVTAGAAGLTFAFAMLIFGGEPQAWVVAHLIFGVEAAYLYFTERSRTSFRRVGFGLAVVMMADLITSVQWVPTLAEIRLGSHLTGQIEDSRHFWAFTPVSWLASIWREGLTSPIRHISNLWVFDHRDSPNPGMTTMTWNRNPYLGLTWILLVLFALGRARLRAAALIGAFALILALGNQTPLAGWLEKLIPVLAKFRFPSKYLPLLTLVAAIGAASAIPAIRINARLRKFFIRSAIAVTGLHLIIALTAWIGSEEIDRWAKNISADWPRVSAPIVPPTLSSFLIISSLVAAAPLGIAAFLTVYRHRSTKYLFFIAALVILDLIAASIQSLPVGPRMLTSLTQSPVLEVLKERPGEPTLCHDDNVSAITLKTWADSGMWPQIFLYRLAGRPNLGICDGVRLGVGYSAVSSGVKKNLSAALAENDTYGEMGLGCTHLLTHTRRHHLLLKELHFKAHPDRMNLADYLFLYEVVDPLPDAFFARNPVFLGDEKTVAYLTAKTSKYAEIIRAVDDPRKIIRADTALPSGEKIISVKLKKINPSRLDLLLEGAGGAIVGTKTSYSFGWKASQAGRPLRVVRMAGAQLGVWVEDVAAGPVSLVYRPPHFEWVLPLSSLAAALLVGFLWICERRRKRRLSP